MKNFFNSYLKDNLPFWVFGIIAIILLAVSFLLPPTGSIDPTVLEGVAELFAFASLGAVYKAISKGTNATVRHGNTSVTIGNDADEENLGQDEMPETL